MPAPFGTSESIRIKDREDNIRKIATEIYLSALKGGIQKGISDCFDEATKLHDRIIQPK